MITITTEYNTGPRDEVFKLDGGNMTILEKYGTVERALAAFTRLEKRLENLPQSENTPGDYVRVHRIGTHEIYEHADGTFHCKAHSVYADDLDTAMLVCLLHKNAEDPECLPYVMKLAGWPE